ncbi:MAG: NADP-dependent phosphogluconate dehydrogenase [Phycisphaerales bacterium]|nr:MAG: NADP-dependent phosphogluconate dehydrogenase [Phycisphaerales bacterium]
MSANSASCDVGLIGLAVMGQNLALNLADHGHRVAVYNRTASVTEEFAQSREANMPGAIVGCESLEVFVKALKSPRIVIVLVKAGAPVDAVCESLIEAGLQPEDIVVDGGNSLWTDTIAREKNYRGRLTFFGSGVSGGELGARFGPSLMPGGDPDAWSRLKPIWEAIAAKVDPKTGKPHENYQAGKPITEGEPCTAYIGPNGAGHYVKMVHNGIEYADMQLIAEAYHLLRDIAQLKPPEIAAIFAEWNSGDLDSFLIEITADILQQQDPVTGQPLVDVVLDRAGQKGTGRWTAENALELGVPAMSIAEAVFARAMSAIKPERESAARILGDDHQPSADHRAPADRDTFIAAVRDALYCSKLCAYAQGFQLMAAAQHEYDWQFNFGEIAKIWRGGCIIRARFLQRITEAYERDPKLANLLLDPHFAGEVKERGESWREVIATAVRTGVPTPAFSSALAYFDSYRSAVLPANLIQAQRDYFGAHTYERTDQPAGQWYHIDWPHPDRPQVTVR